MCNRSQTKPSLKMLLVDVVMVGLRLNLFEIFKPSQTLNPLLLAGTTRIVPSKKRLMKVMPIPIGPHLLVTYMHRSCHPTGLPRPWLSTVTYKKMYPVSYKPSLSHWLCKLDVGFRHSTTSFTFTLISWSLIPKGRNSQSQVGNLTIH